jgi:hypothetical protein
VAPANNCLARTNKTADTIVLRNYKKAEPRPSPWFKSRVSEIGAWAVTKKEKYWEDSRLSAETQEREMRNATVPVAEAIVNIAEMVMRLRSQWPVANGDEIDLAVEEASDFLQGLGEPVQGLDELTAAAQLLERRRLAEEDALERDN